VKRRWDERNFRSLPHLLAVMEAVRPRLSAGAPCDLFALSDEQLLYVLTGKRPPYYANLYDGSPLEAQQRTVRWLETQRPAVVVWKPSRQVLHLVPAVVRAPLVFEKVILSYVPAQTVGDYVVLRPRAPAEPVDLAFWGGHLGDVPLRHLPRFSSFPRFGDWREGSPVAEFLRVRCTEPPDGPSEAVVGTTAGGRRFQLRLTLVPREREYTVYLDRLWFWGGLRRAGFQPALADHTPGVEVSVVRRAGRDDLLY
jgi:hypothetical protein